MIVLMALTAAMPNAIVLRPVANMHSRPDANSDVISQAIYGANVTVLARQDEWTRIRTADDYQGWVRGDSLRLGESYAVCGEVAQVESLFAHVYRERSVTRHAPLITLPFETRVEVSGRDPDHEQWLEVRLAGGESGWLQAGDVTMHPAPLSIPEMIEFSKRFIGLPYTWGGTSSYGYDCSGFVQMLFRRRGVMLPRDAAPQAAWSGLTAVAREALEPGDLLYFGPSPERITHTGLYIGAGQFINATSHEKPMVRICNLEDSHWTERLVACRRLK
jgi:cell wall-associated NlpC family hydrolase